MTQKIKEVVKKIIDGARQVIDNYKPTIDINPIWEMKELESLINFVSGVTLSIPDCEDENGIKIVIFEIKKVIK